MELAERSHSSCLANGLGQPRSHRVVVQPCHTLPLTLTLTLTLPLLLLLLLPLPLLLLLLLPLLLRSQRR